MGSSVSENSPPISFDLQMLIRELSNSRNLTTQLEILLRKHPQEGVSESAYALAHNILLSVTHVLSMLNSGDSHDVCWNSATTHHTSPFSGDRKIKNSGDRPKTPAAHDQRGEHKRRRTCTSSTKTILSPTPYDDGHVWRKYGQKDILGAKYPRGYFRCTHKTDQGCQAIKQVQRSETEASLYVVTYMGQHTCKDVLIKAPQLILDSTCRERSCVLNFESVMPRMHDNPHFSSIKHESIEQKPIDLNQASSSPSTYLASFDDHVSFDSNLSMEKFSMTLLGRGDVGSSVYSSTSSHALDMGMMGSVEFEDVLRFDEPGFL